METNVKKFKRVKVGALVLKKGHLLICVDGEDHYVKTRDGVMCYNLSEMKEIYNFDIFDHLGTWEL